MGSRWWLRGYRWLLGRAGWYLRTWQALVANSDGDDLMESAPVVDEPNAPLIYQDEEGRDLCADCAEKIGLDEGTITAFVNWRDYDHRCFICDERFELEDEDE